MPIFTIKKQEINNAFIDNIYVIKHFRKIKAKIYEKQNVFKVNINGLQIDFPSYDSALKYVEETYSNFLGLIGCEENTISIIKN